MIVYGESLKKMYLFSSLKELNSGGEINFLPQPSAKLFIYIYGAHSVKKRCPLILHQDKRANDTLRTDRG